MIVDNCKIQKLTKPYFSRKFFFLERDKAGLNWPKMRAFFYFYFLFFLKFLNFFIMYQISSNYVDILLLNIAVILC